jgi:hypothetical protein
VRIASCLWIDHPEANVSSQSQTLDAVRTRTSQPPALHDLLRRIEGEYREMPGMSVTMPQAQRLWGLDAITCAFILKTLVDRRILRRTPHGTFVKC